MPVPIASVTLTPPATFAAILLAVSTALVPVPQVWVLLLGALTPLVTYVLNHFAPWAGEAVKATVLAVVAVVVFLMLRLATGDPAAIIAAKAR